MAAISHPHPHPQAPPDAPHRRPDVVVVGAGLAGLTAAATAARAGAVVTVLDARSTAGGRARSETAEGFSLNQGAHALYRAMAGWRVLTELGITPRGGRPPARGLTPWDDRLVPLPLNPVDLLRSPVVGARGTARLARLLARPAALLDRPTEGRSAAELIEELAPEPDAAAVLRTLTRVATYVDDPAAIDGRAALVNLVAAATDGVVYLDGGWAQLIAALTDSAVAAGAHVQTTTKVGAVRADRHGVVVEADGRELRAGAAVLAAGGPRHAAELLGGTSDVVAGWAATERPVVASALDLGLRRLPVDGRRLAFALEAPLYLSVHTPSADLAPAGGEVVHLLRYGDAPDARAALEDLADRVQPGWRDEVVVERYGRRLVVAHGRPEPGSGLEGRPSCTVPDLANVAVAGDWVGPEGLLADAALASGAHAGRIAAARAEVMAP